MEPSLLFLALDMNSIRSLENKSFNSRLPSSAEKTAGAKTRNWGHLYCERGQADLLSPKSKSQMTEIRHIITFSHEPYILTSSIGEDIPPGRRKVFSPVSYRSAGTALSQPFRTQEEGTEVSTGKQRKVQT